MAIEITRELLLQMAANSRERSMTMHAEETGYLMSNLTAGGNDYTVTYHRDSAGHWIVSGITNADGTPID